MSAVEPHVQRLAQAGAPAPGQTLRLLLIVNPHAAAMSPRVRRDVLEALRRRYAVDAVDTERKGHAIELAREAAGEGYDAIVAFGGDGTVNEVANGLVGSPTPVACLPGGSANVFARILGLPNDVDAATRRLLDLADDFRPRAVDLGRAGDRWFTFSAGVGLDASVVQRVDRHRGLKRRLGSWYFAGSGISVFLRRYVVRPPRLEVHAGGGTWRGVTAMVQNARPYSYFRTRPVDLAEGGALDSGDLAGVVLTRASAADMPSMLWRVLSTRARVVEHPRVEEFRGAADVVVRSLDGRPVPVQVDGDHVGDALEVRFEVAPGALRVVA